MALGPSHYTRDWKLLASVCKKRTAIRAQFGLGSRATQEQIEAIWDDIFNADAAAWPSIRRVFEEMMRDPDLVRDLRSAWLRMKRSRPWRLRGFLFGEVQPKAVMKLCWTAIRTSCDTVRDSRSKLECWGRF
jgi:hypothetical protein